MHRLPKDSSKGKDQKAADQKQKESPKEDALDEPKTKDSAKGSIKKPGFLQKKMTSSSNSAKVDQKVAKMDEANEVGESSREPVGPQNPLAAGPSSKAAAEKPGSTPLVENKEVTP